MENKAVIKSKVEISRNLSGYSFPHKLLNQEAQIIIDKIKNILDNFEFEHEFILNKTVELSNLEIDSLLEREVIDNNFLLSENSAIFTNSDKTVCILINGLDHIKIVAIGYNGIEELYEVVNRIDDKIGSNISYAFDKKLGYLTTCPVNVGTGLKVTNTVHIPSIERLKQIDDYFKIAHKIGVCINGFYGNTKFVQGSLYQVSNLVSIGRSEENIIKSVESISRDLTNREEENRVTRKSLEGIELEDEVFRSLAILSNARVLTNSELLRHLSNIKLGIEMEYLNDISLEKVLKLMTGNQPYLKVISAFDDESIEERASYIRKEFSLANRNNKI